MAESSLLIYLLRRDLRLEDNPVFDKIAKRKDNPYTYCLPLYIFSAQQIEVSGFIPKESEEKCPYPEARSTVGSFWRCGPHRAKFLAESVWDLKESLEEVGNGLEVRVGMVGEVIQKFLDEFKKNAKPCSIGGVWMTAEEGVEEKREERDVKKVCDGAGIEFRLFADEKYFIDDRDLPFKSASDLPDVFTTYRKTVEPLRTRPRDIIPTPRKSSLPPPPPADLIPKQHHPFSTPTSYSSLETSLLSPLIAQPMIAKPPTQPSHIRSAHPFRGGSKAANARIDHLISSGSITNYKSTRNGLVGEDYSTKLSAWLALGCITARQVHHSLLTFEDGDSDVGREAEGYGKGENEGTIAVRFELLWRDYMRLCTRKFGPKLFRISGFKVDDSYPWKSPANPKDSTLEEISHIIERVLNGTTGMGLIDASQRELFLTGYTSNRARQNVASFIAKHLGLDWRLGAEWYECMLIDYDVSSNWGNWQYVAGVGNDPRGEARVFNPVKQAWDYDAKADFVRSWIPELAKVEDPSVCFQAWTLRDEAQKTKLGLKGLEWVERPLKRIEFTVGRRGASSGGGAGRRMSSGRGFRRGGPGGGNKSAGGERGMSRSGGQSRGGTRGGWGRGGNAGRGQGGRGRESGAGGGREGRVGMMEKDQAARQGYDAE